VKVRVPGREGPPLVVVVGDLAVDVLVAPSVPPVAGADVPARITTGGGGAGANTAAWLADRGAEVTLVARVGDDATGRAAVAELAAAGVRTSVRVDPDAPTATVVVLLGDADARPVDQRRSGARRGSTGGMTGERTMLSDRGAAARLAPADLPALRDVDHLHLSGYVLRDAGSRPAGAAALAAARAAGTSTSVDPQASGALSTELLRDLGRIDLLLPNADELAVLTGSEDPRSAIALLDVAGAVVVTHGSTGASWVDSAGVWSVPARAVDVVDPTGAGDAFDAGLLAAWLSGAGPEEALAAGCAAGAAAVSRRGARPARPRCAGPRSSGRRS
jgi:sugar/nucleoside kinase (ribokinase family)